jgi:hypothetical protein
VRESLLGATGMVGKAVLREYFLDREVDSIRFIRRATTGQQHNKRANRTPRPFCSFRNHSRTSPIRMPIVTASVRLEAPSLSRIELM